MKKNLSKKLLAVLCAFVLCLSLSTTAFAQNTPQVTKATESKLSNARGYATLLKVGPYYAFNGSKSFTVTPQKGHNLTVQVNTTGSEVTVKAKKVGSLFYESSVTVPPDGSTHTYKMINNCNGGNYQVTFQSNGVATFSATISQTQYN